ncbi:hypothetical protein VOLCADRAFT_103868 [Volvox carteri f. nagariensis]|uniref:Smr domain-containing protein n=1 Tax=Volvox carteri f. nagariensis TaxID=3068 RepID=D8TPR6_VOLCA|nr:uncharacterized protein VOLCADRAFT_103868 [Volvox carteri f. nagariensis]EFJ50812.1 hypothetical protein VOLCADRAFT_103868 [Volvox carteri f. nagariensis]|eukprot:XP_002948405.1 hypothetical protein VOLCADRAFT_103868 [Volvox carteri f. nagariensis]
MLNISAKEFVPTASPKTAAAATTVPPARDSAADSGGYCITKGNGTTANDVSDRPAGSYATKAQLSPQAPEFVPRNVGCSSCTAGANSKSCLLDSTASDPPRSVLTPPRSDSTLSSSIEFREAEACWSAGEGYSVEGQWYGEEGQPGLCDGVAYDMTNVNGYCGYYYQGMDQQEQVADQQGYDGCIGGGYVVAATAVTQGGESNPCDGTATCVYDPYAYSLYDGYSVPYSGAAADTLGAAMYYDVQYAYDASQPYESYRQEAYYWDESAGAYVYGGAQYGTEEYSGWQSASALPPFQQPQLSCDELSGAPAANTTAAAAKWASSAVAPGADGELGLADEELQSLALADATELLEMFFPAYAGEALTRLLERTNGDFLAAFSELAAMEGNVGAERAAAGGSKYSRSKGVSGGKGPGAGGKAAAARRSGGGAATFNLDLEASPQAGSASTGAAMEDGDQIPQEPSASSTGGSNLSACTSAPAPAAAAAPSVSSSKPNFASMLRNSPSAPAAASSPAPQPLSSSKAAADGGGCSSSGYRTAGKASAAAVPWVSTGEAVSAQYAEERREAAMLARARNQCFQQATLAYLSGNKALAKQLGRRGRELNEAMKAAHAAAARRIFAQRNGAAASGANTHNKGSSSHHQQQHARRQQARQHHVAGRESAAATFCGSGESHHQGAQQQQQQRSGNTAGGEAMFVDLHGLHVAEAVAVLEAQIEASRAAGCRFLRVCTGAGAHTKTHARLPAAVADALLSNHLTFKTLKPGLLEAQL